jgi:hypothetical protein
MEEKFLTGGAIISYSIVILLEKLITKAETEYVGEKNLYNLPPH